MVLSFIKEITLFLIIDKSLRAQCTIRYSEVNGPPFYYSSLKYQAFVYEKPASCGQWSNARHSTIHVVIDMVWKFGPEEDLRQQPFKLLMIKIWFSSVMINRLVLFIRKMICISASRAYLLILSIRLFLVEEYMCMSYLNLAQNLSGTEKMVFL